MTYTDDQMTCIKIRDIGSTSYSQFGTSEYGVPNI